MTDDGMSQNVAQARLDSWRAFAEQTRTDLFTVRQFIAARQPDAANTLIAAMQDSAIIAGLDMEDAGANRPHTLPPKPGDGS